MPSVPKPGWQEPGVDRREGTPAPSSGTYSAGSGYRCGGAPGQRHQIQRWPRATAAHTQPAGGLRARSAAGPPQAQRSGTPRHGPAGRWQLRQGVNGLKRWKTGPWCGLKLSPQNAGSLRKARPLPSPRAPPLPLPLLTRGPAEPLPSPSWAAAPCFFLAARPCFSGGPCRPPATPSTNWCAVAAGIPIHSGDGGASLLLQAGAKPNHPAAPPAGWSAPGAATLWRQLVLNSKLRPATDLGQGRRSPNSSGVQAAAAVPVGSGHRRSLYALGRQEPTGEPAAATLPAHPAALPPPGGRPARTPC